MLPRHDAGVAAAGRPVLLLGLLRAAGTHGPLFAVWRENDRERERENERACVRACENESAKAGNRERDLMNEQQASERERVCVSERVRVRVRVSE
jgi:hypothetical protein